MELQALAPGEKLVETWDGTIAVEERLEPSCVECAFQTCPRIAPASAGTYKFSLAYSDRADCVHYRPPTPCIVDG